MDPLSIHTLATPHLLTYRSLVYHIRNEHISSAGRYYHINVAGRKYNVTTSGPSSLILLHAANSLSTHTLPPARCMAQPAEEDFLLTISEEKGKQTRTPFRMQGTERIGTTGQLVGRYATQPACRNGREEVVVVMGEAMLKKERHEDMCKNANTHTCRVTCVVVCRTAVTDFVTKRCRNRAD